jgi:hypothetical protein
MLSAENFDIRNIVQYFAEKFQSCTNKNTINSEYSFLSSIHKLRCFARKSHPSSSSHFMLLTLFNASLCFRFLFFYKRFLSRPLRVSYCWPSYVVFFSSLTNLIIFACLLIYSFSFIFSALFPASSYLDLCRLLCFSFIFFAILWKRKHLLVKLWFLFFSISSFLLVFPFLIKLLVYQL